MATLENIRAKIARLMSGLWDRYPECVTYTSHICSGDAVFAADMYHRGSPYFLK